MLPVATRSGIFATLNQTIFREIDEQYSNSAPQPLVISPASIDLCRVSPDALPVSQKWHAARVSGRGGRRASECAAGNAGAPRRPLHDCISTLPPATAPERVVAGWRRPGRARRLRFLYVLQLQLDITIRLAHIAPQSRDLMRMSLHSSAILPSFHLSSVLCIGASSASSTAHHFSSVCILACSVHPRQSAIHFLNALLRVYNQLSNFIFISKTQ